MTLTIQRADLARVLSVATKATESRNTIPILGNVLLHADGDRLTVTATNLDIQISATTVAAGDINTTVDAKRLSDIARRLAGDSVIMHTEDNKLIVKSGRVRFTLPTLPVEDFPSLEIGIVDVTFSVDLAALIAPVKFAISNEATRFYLNGVYLHTYKDTLRAVTTDGHRMAHNSAALATTIPNVILPAKTVGLIPAGVVTVDLSKHKIRIATAESDSGGIVIVSKLIDYTYPDYQRAIPTNNNNVVTVDRQELADAVARASLVTSERGSAAKFTIAGDNIAIDMRGNDGTAHEDVTAVYSGDPIEIGFNTRYASDILAAAAGDEVTIALADSGTPAIFRGAGEWVGLVMPMRV